jgi:hypothetical protein
VKVLPVFPHGARSDLRSELPALYCNGRVTLYPLEDER